MAPAKHLPINAQDRIHSLFPAQLRSFFDAVQRCFGRSTENGKDGNFSQSRDAVVTPFAQSNHFSIQTKDLPKLVAIKTNLLGQAIRTGKGRRRLNRHSLMLRAPNRKSSPTGRMPRLRFTAAIIRP